MTDGLQAAAFLVFALVGLAAAIVAGIEGDRSPAVASALPPPACCLHMIF